MTGTALIMGLAYDTPNPLARFTVRTGPGTNFDPAAFMAEVGLSNLEVLDVQPDSQDTHSDFGRVYQWFHMTFPDGQTGWVRDHVVGIVGDFSLYGYGIVDEPIQAYLLERNMIAAEKARQTAEIMAAKEQIAKETAEMKAQAAAQEQQETATVNPMAAAAQQQPATQDDSELNPLAAAAQQQAGSQQSTTTQTDQQSDVPPVMVKTAVTVRPSGPPMATIKTQSGATVREGPSTIGYDRLFTIPRNTTVEITDVAPDTRASRPFKWYQVNYQGQLGWIREDLVTYGGDTEGVNLPWDLYPAPMTEGRWWIRDYNNAHFFDPSEFQHLGWDFGAEEGEPIYCGPLGGRVVAVLECSKCTAAQPSTVSQNLGLGNQAVFEDPAWGFGYGNAVIVGYDNAQLPETTKKYLVNKGYSGGSVFVMYGHLMKRSVEVGQQFNEATIIGLCGNTGNSEAPHLHLEVRAASSSTFTRWADIKNGLDTPQVLFKR